MAEVFQPPDCKHLEGETCKKKEKWKKKSETHKSLLMAEPVEAGVLKVLNIDGGHLVHRGVSLLPQAEKRKR